MASTTVTGKFPDDKQPIIGDDMYQRFLADAKVPSDGPAINRVIGEAVHHYTEWLLSTPAGAQTLKRINDTPRQLHLDFGDERVEGQTG